MHVKLTPVINKAELIPRQTKGGHLAHSPLPIQKTERASLVGTWSLPKVLTVRER